MAPTQQDVLADYLSSMFGENLPVEEKSLEESQSGAEVHVDVEELKDTELSHLEGVAESLKTMGCQVDDDKQLICLFNLALTPSKGLSSGEKATFLMDLFTLLQKVPESRLRSMMEAQFEQVSRL